MTFESKSGQAVMCALFVFMLLAPVGKSAGQNGDGISQPLTMLPGYQARAPRKCSAMSKPPSAAQATVLVQCAMDALSETGLALVQDVHLQIGLPRPYVHWTDAVLGGVDLKAKIYPLHGSYTGYLCNAVSKTAPAGQSCLKSTVPTASGWCWKTVYGDWRCKMQGGGPDTVKAAAPQTF